MVDTGACLNAERAECRMVKTAQYGRNAERDWAVCRTGGMPNGLNAENCRLSLNCRLYDFVYLYRAQPLEIRNVKYFMLEFISVLCILISLMSRK